MINLILFGPPGSGKGTQSAALVEHYGLKHISTGEILRKEIQEETELGQQAKALMDKGQLVPDEIIVAMIEEIVAKHKTVKGFIFDGFPRTVSQAEALDALLSRNGQQVSQLLELVVPDNMLMERLLLRKQQEGRADDNLETIQRRLTVYHTQTAPIAAYYKDRGLSKSIDGVGAVEQVTQRLFEVVDTL
ncbi:adenylate kinase [Porphyromonas circumdentaria]|uniref:Adenylate kinase n=1 Tax=Porphyromonas circumdentaria TaxID=29524 RepID=A0A1T4NJY5_9PORP|nr:adenylate kinase [Porphyromonas circumdentaria]MBB6276113.1 adenylate kinase [Porphyromonas circumdentaria]MDO4722758.1 adenylate kinase [Porphyromonas circumdentaria]SJZ79631.1 Adenylate kinase [Porphyromonas circumdentaria]